MQIFSLFWGERWAIWVERGERIHHRYERNSPERPWAGENEQICERAVVLMWNSHMLYSLSCRGVDEKINIITAAASRRLASGRNNSNRVHHQQQLLTNELFSCHLFYLCKHRKTLKQQLVVSFGFVCQESWETSWSPIKPRGVNFTRQFYDKTG